MSAWMLAGILAGATLSAAALRLVHGRDERWWVAVTALDIGLALVALASAFSRATGVRVFLVLAFGVLAAKTVSSAHRGVPCGCTPGRTSAGPLEVGRASTLLAVAFGLAVAPSAAADPLAQAALLFVGVTVGGLVLLLPALARSAWA